MSDWDEQTEQKAGEVFPDPGAKPPTAEYPLAALRHGKRGAYVLGAKWQREQLHTDEAVERAAEAIYLSHDSYSFFTAKPWAEMVKSKDKANRFRVKQDRKAARAAITALLGEGA